MTRRKLSVEQVEAIRRRIEEREVNEAIAYVVDGSDLDYGRVSRMEWIATGRIKLDAEDIDALLCDGDQAESVRRRVDARVDLLTREWLDTVRGMQWLEERVEEYLGEEIAQQEDHLAEMAADARRLERFERT